ncbi:MAG: hypothetical protein DWH84_00555 [Planctomycetota bacterium]|nr:MAG: hypothetical protein DWH84_00555 [Planctomycetota bacterium]
MELEFFCGLNISSGSVVTDNRPVLTKGHVIREAGWQQRTQPASSSPVDRVASATASLMQFGNTSRGP